MDSRVVAAILSALISQIVILVPQLFPPTSTSTSHPSSNRNSYQEAISSLIAHLHTSAEIASSLSLIPLQRKRRRTNDSDFNSDSEPQDKDSVLGTRLGELERVDPIIGREPDAFRLFFKMTPPTFEWLCGLLDPLLDCRDPIGSSLNLSSELRLGIGLYRLSTGSDYAEIAARFMVSERVARFCTKQLCRVLCTNFRFWVGFPTPDELKSISDGFQTLSGLPNCCGVIDCIRFNFRRTDSVSEETIAAQIVVDSTSRILNIVAGYHGDNSDTRILKSSALYKDIQGGRLLNTQPITVEGVAVHQYFIGHTGYPLLPWLLVPFNEPSPGPIQENFNASCNMMRVSMVKTSASLKNWGILSRPVESEYRDAVASIGACAILHNALLKRQDYSAFCDEVGDDLISDVSRHNGVEEEPIERMACGVRTALGTTVNDP